MSHSSRVEKLNGIVNGDAIRSYRVPIGIVLIALLIRPLLEITLGSAHIATTILIWMLFTAAFNLLFGYGGLLSFGHAMFLGTGVYTTAIGLAHFDLPFSLLVVAAVGIAGALAYVIGRITVHYGEIYFAMLTLAFAMAIHFVIDSNPAGLTGGANGLNSGTTPGWISSFRGERIIDVPWFADLLGLFGLEPSYYWFVAAVFVVTMLLLWQVLRSPFGRTLVAVRDNEDLARAMGISANRYKVWAFTISGAFSAVAGALLMINNYGAALRNFGPTTSAEVLLMTIFGGASSFFGPLVGALSWFGIREFLQSFDAFGGLLSYWQFFFGFAFIVVILIAPRDGLWGFVRNAALGAIAIVRRWYADD